MEYRGPDGTTVIADSLQTLIHGPLLVNRAAVEQSGLSPDGTLIYWTGLDEDGTANSHCGDWTGESESGGGVGNMDWGSSPVPVGWMSSFQLACSSAAHLMCLCWN